MGKLPEEVMVEELKVNFNRPVHEERLLFKGFQDNGAEKVHRKLKDIISQDITDHHRQLCVHILSAKGFQNNGTTLTTVGGPGMLMENFLIHPSWAQNNLIVLLCTEYAP